MNYFIDTSMMLLAQGGAANEAQGPNLSIVLMPLVIIFFLYMLIVQRPQRREQAERQSMLRDLKKDDHVLLTSGIYGVVTNVRQESDDVTVRVDDTTNAKLRVARAAIARVITDEPSTDAGKTKDSGT